MSIEVVTRMSLGQTSGHGFALVGRALSWCRKKPKPHINVSYGGRLCILLP